jgi:hypothetical protein
MNNFKDEANVHFVKMALITKMAWKCEVIHMITPFFYWFFSNLFGSCWQRAYHAIVKYVIINIDNSCQILDFGRYNFDE